MNEATPLNENELVYAALSLCGNKVQGNKPDWKEIEAWQQKTLPEERADEVLSHIANDPDCFQQWLDICEATEWLAQEAPQDNLQAAPAITSPAKSVKAWFGSLFAQPLPVYAGGFAAVVLAVLIVPLLQTGGNMQQRLDDSFEYYMAAPPGSVAKAPLPRKTRTMGNLLGDTTPAEIEQHYFNEGLRQGLAKLQASPGADWSAWLESLPEKELDCTKATDPGACGSVAEDFHAVGQWAIMVYSACQGVLTNAAENGEFWQNQITLHSDLQQLPAMQDSVLLRPAMSSHTGNDKESVCTSVGQLLNTLQ